MSVYLIWHRFFPVDHVNLFCYLQVFQVILQLKRFLSALNDKALISVSFLFKKFRDFVECKRYRSRKLPFHVQIQIISLINE